MNSTNGWTGLTTVAMLLALAVAGCTKSDHAGTASPAASVPATKPDAHADHPSHGPHGGALAEWGDEEYHAEFTVDHPTQQATVYILDGTAKKAKPIAAKRLTATLKTTPPVTVTLDAAPQAGDPPGQASRFAGKAAALGKEQEFADQLAESALEHLPTGPNTNAALCQESTCLIDQSGPVVQLALSGPVHSL